MLRQALVDQVDVFLAPDLNGEDFTQLDMDSWLATARRSLVGLQSDDQLLLSGSSLGAYTAALLAADKEAVFLPAQTQLLLLAPAFGFSQQWSQILGGEDAMRRWQEQGSLPFYHYHYQRDMQVSYAFYESCARLPAIPDKTSVSGSLIHGLHDEVLGRAHVDDYAAVNPQLHYHLLDDDHALLSTASQELMRKEALRLVQQFA